MSARPVLAKSLSVSGPMQASLPVRVDGHGGASLNRSKLAGAGSVAIAATLIALRRTCRTASNATHTTTRPAVQIAGWDGPRLAATARVVYPSPDRPLPTETAFGVTVEPRGQVVDAGRLIVAPEHRDGQHRVLGGLAACIWVAMASCGFQWAAVAISSR